MKIVWQQNVGPNETIFSFYFDDHSPLMFLPSEGNQQEEYL